MASPRVDAGALADRGSGGAGNVDAASDPHLAAAAPASLAARPAHSTASVPVPPSSLATASSPPPVVAATAAFESFSTDQLRSLALQLSARDPDRLQAALLGPEVLSEHALLLFAAACSVWFVRVTGVHCMRVDE
jgi:hypothetical protein